MHKILPETASEYSPYKYVSLLHEWQVDIFQGSAGGRYSEVVVSLELTYQIITQKMISPFISKKKLEDDSCSIA